MDLPALQVPRDEPPPAVIRDPAEPPSAAAPTFPQPLQPPALGPGFPQPLEGPLPGTAKPVTPPKKPGGGSGLDPFDLRSEHP